MLHLLSHSVFAHLLEINIFVVSQLQLIHFLLLDFTSYKRGWCSWGWMEGLSFLKPPPPQKLHDGTNFVDIVILGGGVLD